MGLFNFNRLRQEEGKIINRVDKNLKDKKDYVPNKRLNGRKTVEEFEDEYVKKTQAAKNYGQKPEVFTDADGRSTPIEQLDGQTERLLREARQSIQEEIVNNKRLGQLDANETKEDTPEKAKNEEFTEKMGRDNPHSIHKFYSGRGRTP